MPTTTTFGKRFLVRTGLNIFPRSEHALLSLGLAHHCSSPSPLLLAVAAKASPLLLRAPACRAASRALKEAWAPVFPLELAQIWPKKLVQEAFGLAHCAAAGGRASASQTENSNTQETGANRCGGPVFITGPVGVELDLARLPDDFPTDFALEFLAADFVCCTEREQAPADASNRRPDSAQEPTMEEDANRHAQPTALGEKQLLFLAQHGGLNVDDARRDSPSIAGFLLSRGARRRLFWDLNLPATIYEWQQWRSWTWRSIANVLRHLPRRLCSLPRSRAWLTHPDYNPARAPRAGIDESDSTSAFVRRGDHSFLGLVGDASNGRGTECVLGRMALRVAAPACSSNDEWEEVRRRRERGPLTAGEGNSSTDERRPLPPAYRIVDHASDCSLRECSSEDERRVVTENEDVLPVPISSWRSGPAWCECLRFHFSARRRAGDAGNVRGYRLVVEGIGGNYRPGRIVAWAAHPLFEYPLRTFRRALSSEGHVVYPQATADEDFAERIEYIRNALRQAGLSPEKIRNTLRKPPGCLLRFPQGLPVRIRLAPEEAPAAA